MIVISKEHEADFGHRVWSQELDGEFSGSIECKCKHLHGHRLKIIVELTSEVGLQLGMVTDFSHLKKFFNWVDDLFDHKFLVDINDPALGKHLFPFVKDNKKALLAEIEAGYGAIQMTIKESSLTKPEREIYEGLTIVNWVPTAENISEFLGKHIRSYLPENIICKSILFYETPKSKAQWIA